MNNIELANFLFGEKLKIRLSMELSMVHSKKNNSNKHFK